MTTLFCFGLGYCARHYLRGFGQRYERVVGTVRSAESAALLAWESGGFDGVEILRFASADVTPQIVAALDETDVLLVSVPPVAGADRVLEAYSGVLVRAPRLRTLIYLSSVGVYGDHDGAIVAESTPPRPRSERAQARLAAETAWRRLAEAAGMRLSILRLAGIYGPKRNALVSLTAGRARAIVKPGQVFNRIHVSDIGQAIEAAILEDACGVFNVADDLPAPPQDVIGYAASLLGCEPPPQEAFASAQATMTPRSRSFYEENRRVANRKLKTELGVRLRYPTYREGLRALHEQGAGSAPG